MIKMGFWIQCCSRSLITLLSITLIILFIHYNWLKSVLDSIEIFNCHIDKCFNYYTNDVWVSVEMKLSSVGNKTNKTVWLRNFDHDCNYYNQLAYIPCYYYNDRITLIDPSLDIYIPVIIVEIITIVIVFLLCCNIQYYVCSFIQNNRYRWRISTNRKYDDLMMRLL